jgi:hypothetical protein
MSRSFGAEIDLIEELRLRNWARANYVLPELRDPGWHPLVLEEMRLKDTEFEMLDDRSHRARALVPLAPDCFYQRHPYHPVPNAPKLLLSVQAVGSQARAVALPTESILPEGGYHAG